MIVGLCGYAQVGKDTIADGLENYTKHAFATVLKQEVSAMLKQVGLTPELWGKDKAEWRDMLVFWGAKRRSIDPEYWIKQLFARMCRGMLAGDRMTITDVRYANEVEWIRKHRGIVIRVTRPGHYPANAEERKSFDEIDLRFDLPILVNDGKPEEAVALTRKIISSRVQMPNGYWRAE